LSYKINQALREKNGACLYHIEAINLLLIVEVALIVPITSSFIEDLKRLASLPA
jgi:hypothetical protein